MPRARGVFSSRLFVLLAALAAVVFAPIGSAEASGGFVYALQQVDGAPNQLFGFRLNEATGALTELPGFPIDTGGTGTVFTLAETVRYDPATGHLYVINDGTDTLSVYAVNRATGALTALPYSPIALGPGLWSCVTVHPSGSPVVVGAGNGNLASFVVTPTSATAASGSPYLTSGVLSGSCTFSKDGHYVYTGADGPFSMAGFSVSPSTGVLTPLPGSPFNVGSGDGYATDTTGRLFSVNFGSNQVRVFTTSSGIPAGVAGNPFSAGGLSSGRAGVLHPAGFYIVGDRSKDGKVGVYHISGSGPGTTLTGVGGSPFLTGGSFTLSLAVTNGSIVLAANGVSRNLTVFGMNLGTGDLTSLLLQPANTLGTSGVVTGVEFAPGFEGVPDFDGDGKADLFLRNSVNGQNIGWLMSGLTVSNSAFLPTIADTNWEVKGIGNFDGDGKADVLWRNKATGQNIGWLMNALTVTNSAFLPTIADTNWEIKGVGDFDGDGKADVVWRNKVTGQNIGWLMNGLTVSSSAFLPTIADTNWEIKGVGDLDGNGKADVIWRNKVSGQNIAWLMNGLTVANSTFLPTIADTNWEIRGVGDFDGDGKADVLWRNKANGQNIGWLMNGLTVSNSAFLPTIADTNWEIKGVGDFDGDGKADVVWRNKVSGQNIGWLMNGLAVATSAFLPTIADTNWDFVGMGQ